MEWFKTDKVEMPKDREFQVYIGDVIGLCEWSPRDQLFFLASEPAYSASIRVVNEKLMNRITHWAEMPDKPTRSDDIE